MESIWNLLEELNCENIDQTKQRFGNNEVFYKKIIAMLFKDPDMQQLGECIKNGDVTSTFTAAHTLKGTIGNCGFTNMYNIIVRIVEPARSGTVEGLYPVFEEFQKEKERTEQAMQKYL